MLLKRPPRRVEPPDRKLQVRPMAQAECEPLGVTGVLIEVLDEQFQIANRFIQALESFVASRGIESRGALPCESE